MASRLLFAPVAALAFACVPAAQAASLNVTPIKLEVAAPGATALATLTNEGKVPLNAQVRIFRWSQEGGQDKLTPTDDVVASPPIASVAPGRPYQVRIVRTVQAPVQGEESYRLVIDELPDPNRQRNGTVTMVIRYSVPVFFTAPEASRPNLTWRLTSRQGRPHLEATNAGEGRARIADLTLGRASVGKGLAGYVLGRSTRAWPLPSRASGPVSAMSEQGPIHASLAP